MMKGTVPGRSVRTSFAASTFAGLSVLGFSEDNRDITLRSCTANISPPVLEDILITYDGFDGVYRQPSFASIFIAILVITWRMLKTIPIEINTTSRLRYY
jgi:hypothetical protein